MSWKIFGADDCGAHRHVIKLPGIELRTRRGCWVTGRVIEAGRPPPGLFQWPYLEQIDVYLDCDWRFWHLQWIPYLRPTGRGIVYTTRRHGPRWLGAGDPDDQFSYSTWGPNDNQFGRRLVLMHTLWPAGVFPLAEQAEELVGKVIDMPFFTVDVHAADGTQITGRYDHAKVGKVVPAADGELVTQCPWLLSEAAWQPVIDYQKRRVA